MDKWLGCRSEEHTILLSFSVPVNGLCSWAKHFVSHCSSLLSWQIWITLRGTGVPSPWGIYMLWKETNRRPLFVDITEKFDFPLPLPVCAKWCLAFYVGLISSSVDASLGPLSCQCPTGSTGDNSGIRTVQPLEITVICPQITAYCIETIETIVIDEGTVKCLIKFLANNRHWVFYSAVSESRLHATKAILTRERQVYFCLIV